MLMEKWDSACEKGNPLFHSKLLSICHSFLTHLAVNMCVTKC